MAEFRTVDDFLNYRGSDGGGGKKLKSWAKSKGHLNFWLVCGLMPATVWYHPIPELVIRTDKDTQRGLKNVWNRSHACPEDEKEVLKKQRYRTNDGRREFPPTACAPCRLAEAVREMILDGKIADTDVVFKFDGSDKPEENRVIHAGGLCNFWKRDQSAEEKARLASFGIYGSTSWSESFVAKLNYVLVGVDNDDVASGIQTAIQTQLVGDKIKAEIKKQIASELDGKGNPFLNPYCIQLLYRPEEAKFDDRYLAQRINRYAMTPEIERLIRGPVPSIEKFLKPLNNTEVIAALQKHAVIDLPWAQICKVTAPVAPAPQAPPQDTGRVPEVNSPPTPQRPPPAEEWGDPCDDCKTPMLKTASKCPKCGAVYEQDAEPPKAPPAYVPGAYANAGGAPPANQAPAAPPSLAAAPPATGVPGDYGCGDAVYDDEIPF